MRPGGPVDLPDPDLTVTIHDQATLDSWSQSGFTPAFLDGMEVASIPVEDAVLDFYMEAPHTDGSIRATTLRVRRSDGAIAVVSSEIIIQSSTSEGVSLQESSTLTCSAGDWWQLDRTCCTSQSQFCNAITTLLPFLTVRCDCAECVDECCDCSVGKPCHSCDPCGLSWILCIFFGSC